MQVLGYPCDVEVQFGFGQLVNVCDWDNISIIHIYVIRKYNLQYLMVNTSPSLRSESTAMLNVEIAPA